ncbi:MAG TPA: hypothetical protein VFV49_05565 [Thermoanaerobaculia bacterium]|nr:hypothetical protein [Thermoanaerobaculia bacterium]
MSECLRAQEALDLVRAGRWPDGCDEETRTHITACTDCADSVQVASMIAADYHAAVRTARVPSSGLVWWRAQRRARQEAEHNAARIVTLVQGVSVAIGVTVAVAIAGPESVSHALAFVSTLPAWSLPVLLGLSASLALAPVAVYLAAKADR